MPISVQMIRSSLYKKVRWPTSAFSMTGSTHDIILARLGETYLVAAEAYVKLDQPDKAKIRLMNCANVLQKPDMTFRYKKVI